jgi:HAD superfamily 5'-nucleotidase-like hydrolase
MCAKQAKRWDFGDVDPGRRIYINRNLRLASIRAIGFDMDHTLAQYKPLPFEELAFRKASRKLVERGYSRAVMGMTHDHDFVVRGLIVDKRRGNILKMDRHHYVVRAFHGTRKIPAEMRKTLYANRRIRISGQAYSAIDTLFSLPEITLYAQMVDLVDRQRGKPNYRQIYDDVRGAVDEAHADGSIKRAMARDPLRHLQVDPALPETLDRMRTHGIKLFLLTNSEASYTALVMNRLLSGTIQAYAHWTDFFDVIVVRAAKPGFFAGREPLSPLDARALGIQKRSRPRFTFTGGAVRALEQELQVGGDEILYFGDHTYGDILKSKRVCGWRTAMIIQALEPEIRHREETREQRRMLSVMERRIDQLDAWRDFLERSLEGKISETAVRRFLKERHMAGGLRQIRSHLESLHERIRELALEARQLEADIDTVFNRNWGPIFRAGRETSHFATQVEKFACIYTSRVSNFLNYPMEKYFVATHTSMPHEG